MLLGCTSGLAVSVVVTVVLLLPSLYYGPSARPPEPTFKIPATSPDTQSDAVATSLAVYDDIPAIDVILTASFIVWALIVYLCDWIQRKLMQKRINKLNERLDWSVARLRECDGRRARLDGSLRSVRAAAAEYNLLMYLLLRQHGLPGAPAAPADPADPAPPPDELEDFDVRYDI